MNKTRGNDVELAKSNILLVGPTGSGKTLLAQTLAKMLDVPFAIVDATTLTEAGYVGEDVENIILKLLQAAEGDVARAQQRHHLHRRDRQDRPQGREPFHHPRRLRRRRAAGAAEAARRHRRQRSAAGRPQASAPGVHRRRHDEHPVHLRRRVRRPGESHRPPHRQEGARLQDASPSPTRRKADVTPIRAQRDAELLRQAEPQDLLKYGLIPEFVGRLPVLGMLDELDEAALIEILTKPRNAILKQYTKLFDYEGVKVTFTDDAAREIAREALQRKVGARGLRMILEELMLDLMYYVPGNKKVKDLAITAEMVKKHALTLPMLLEKAG